MRLKEFLLKMEERLIKRALRKTKGNKAQAAEALGVKRTTLVARCQTFGLTNYGVKDAD